MPVAGPEQVLVPFPPPLPQQLNSLKLFQIVNKMLTRNINNFIFHLCQYKEKSSRGITRSRALHVLHSPRLKRDYLRPDVFLSKKKKMKKKPRCPLGSSHILTLEAAGLRQPGGWSVWKCKISGLASGRLFMSSPAHPSYLHQHSPGWLIDSNTALASFPSEANVTDVYTLPGGELGGGVGSQSSFFPV